jgi:hypothetical protein
MPDQGYSDTTSDDSVEQPLPRLIKAYINEQFKESKKSDGHSTNKNWKRSWRSASPITKATLGLTAAVAIATVAYALIAEFQLSEMRRTNRDTEAALGNAAKSSQDASEQFQVQLHHFDASLGVNQIQINKMDRLARATEKAARAAQSASVTAKEALHVSERAYLFIQAPVPNFEQHALTFQIINTGHLPAEHIEIIQHNAIYEVADPSNGIPWNSLATRKWKNMKIPAISNYDKTSGFTPVFPTMDGARLQSGHQMIVVTGFITYEDGFPDHQRWKAPFCVHSTASLVTKHIYFYNCNAEIVLPIMESLDGYPNNEESD